MMNKQKLLRELHYLKLISEGETEKRLKQLEQKVQDSSGVMQQFGTDLCPKCRETLSQPGKCHSCGWTNQKVNQ